MKWTEIVYHTGENMMKKIIVRLLVVTMAFVSQVYADNKRFVIIIPSRNNSEWCERNLASVASQNYENWHAIYINDASTDDTREKVERFRDEHGLQEKITLINNDVRQGALANIVNAVYQCNNGDVIVTLDGDDWFAGDHVLQKLNDVYNDETVWMTYGSYISHPSGNKGIVGQQIPAREIKENSYRKNQWRTSHLRTFYAWLFKCIKIEDLKINGEFFSMAWDLAMIFPMLELSGGRFRYIADILYVYNQETPFNDYKIDQALQGKLDLLIRSRTPYEPLKRMPRKYLLHRWQ